MVKLIYATCRHCGHKFIPRVEFPRQCGRCWKKFPIGKPTTEQRKEQGK